MFFKESTPNEKSQRLGFKNELFSLFEGFYFNEFRCRKCQYCAHSEKLPKMIIDIDFPIKEMKTIKMSFYSSDFEICPIKITFRIPNNEEYTVNALTQDIRKKFKISDPRRTRVIMVGRGRIWSQVEIYFFLINIEHSL